MATASNFGPWNPLLALDLPQKKLAAIGRMAKFSKSMFQFFQKFHCHRCFGFIYFI
jgi:hypothetical protein